MNILSLSTYDAGGGAEKVALELHRSYREAGHAVRMLVRHKRTNDPDVIEIDAYSHTTPWAPALALLERQLQGRPTFRGKYRLLDWARRLAFPGRIISHLSGKEDFHYPYSWHLLEHEWKPDIIHAHNLHGDYFDLRSLGSLSQQRPIVWTLHDTWAFTGHCAHFMECAKWTTGCGTCPDLKRPPAIHLDQTKRNYQFKRVVYDQSRLAIATPSRWLMSHVEKSILGPQTLRVIPNGVDLTVFKPGNRRSSRALLGLPQESFICLYVSSYGSQPSSYKDYSTIAKAVSILTHSSVSPDIFFICIGGGSQTSPLPRTLMTGYITDPTRIALYYQASDVLLHASNAENFPCVTLEAMACGVVVIAADVGGVGEQIRDGVDGFLIAKHDHRAMAQRVLELHAQPARHAQMSAAAAKKVQENYGLENQAQSYLQWFGELRRERDTRTQAAAAGASSARPTSEPCRISS